MGLLYTTPKEVREKLARGERLSRHEEAVLRRDNKLQDRRATAGAAADRAREPIRRAPPSPSLNPAEADRGPKAAPGQRSGIDWRKVGSFRVLIGAAIPALIVGAILGLVWQPLGYVALPVFVLWWLALVTSKTHVLYCPNCAKRVKAGASTCHHCGKSLAPETAI